MHSTILNFILSAVIGTISLYFISKSTGLGPCEVFGIACHHNESLVPPYKIDLTSLPTITYTVTVSATQTNRAFTTPPAATTPRLTTGRIEPNTVPPTRFYSQSVPNDSPYGNGTGNATILPFFPHSGLTLGDARHLLGLIPWCWNNLSSGIRAIAPYAPFGIAIALAMAFGYMLLQLAAMVTPYFRRLGDFLSSLFSHCYLTLLHSFVNRLKQGIHDKQEADRSMLKILAMEDNDKQRIADEMTHHKTANSYHAGTS